MEIILAEGQEVVSKEGKVYLTEKGDKIEENIFNDDKEILSTLKERTIALVKYIEHLVKTGIDIHKVKYEEDKDFIDFYFVDGYGNDLWVTYAFKKSKASIKVDYYYKPYDSLSGGLCNEAVSLSTEDIGWEYISDKVIDYLATSIYKQTKKV